jgi:hypothetical protein
MSALSHGWNNWRKNLVLVPVLYGVKLLLSLLFTVPILVMISGNLQYSGYARSLVSRWDFDVIGEVLRTQPGVAPTMIVVLFSFMVMAFLAKQFLNGGLYDSYLRRRVLLPVFVAESARQTTSHLKISVFMLPIYLLLIFMGGQLSRLVPLSLTGYFGKAGVGGLVVRVVIIAAFVIIGVVISESLRLHRAAWPERAGWRRVKESLDFLRRNGVRLYGYYLLYLMPFVVVWVAVEGSAVWITGGLANGLGILLELMLFQICACVRTGQSLLFTATAAPIFRTYQDSETGTP